MKFFIFSKNQAIEYSYSKQIPNSVILSISSYGEQSPYLHNNPKIKDVLSLHFNDVRVVTSPNQDGVFSKKDVKKIMEFVNKWKDKVDAIVVHCAAGVSRSAAVACSLSMFLNGTDVDLWTYNFISPNRYIYETMLNHLDIPFSEQTWQVRQEIVKERHKQYTYETLLDGSILLS